MTNVNPGTRTYEILLDYIQAEKAIQTKKTIAVDNSPVTEKNYSIWYLLAQRARQQEELKHTMLVNPQKFETSHRPSYSTTPDYFRWDPAEPESPTVYSDPNQTGFSGLSSYSSANTHLYQQTDPMQQHAAVWHQMMQQVNQATHWSQQQAAYLQQTGHASTQSYTQTRQF